jgi:hypothetical protein
VSAKITKLWHEPSLHLGLGAKILRFCSEDT